MNKLSWRHHYVPEFYQKGFTSDKFHVLDKKTGTIQSKLKSPRSIFFEQNRNTCFSGNEETDILETKLFSYLDNRFSIIIQELRNTDINSQYSRETLEEYFVFINFMKLRNPIFDTLIENIFKNNNFNDLGYQIVNTENNLSIDEETIQKFHEDELFIKSHSGILCVLPFIKDNQLTSEIINNHSFFYHGKNHDLCLLSDNPVIFKADENSLKTFQEFIFPLSDTILSVYTKNKKNHFVNRQFLFQKDIALLHQAERFVCCKDEMYLKKCLKFYESLINKNYENEIIDNLFYHFQYKYD
jgi:hypothetical protein